MRYWWAAVGLVTVAALLWHGGDHRPEKSVVWMECREGGGGFGVEVVAGEKWTKRREHQSGHATAPF